MAPARNLSPAAMLVGLALLGAGCYDFSLTGPEDAPTVLPPAQVSVTVEYRQPRGCLNVASSCAGDVVFYASWMKPGDEIHLTPDPATYLWRGLARNVPVNYPPRDLPHFVRVYDPFLRDAPERGITAQRLRVGGQLLDQFDQEGSDSESGLVYIDANGFGHSPL